MTARRLAESVGFALLLGASHLGAQESTRSSPATRPAGRASSIATVGIYLTSNGAALETLRDAFHRPGRKWPLAVGGHEYDEAAFMKELDRLLGERALLAAKGERIALAADEVVMDEHTLAAQLGIHRATIGNLEASKSMLAKPLPTVVERILESARKRLLEAGDPGEVAATRTASESKRATSRSRLTAAEFLGLEPESQR